MKINEIKPQLNEGLADTVISKGASWLGNKASNLIKGKAPQTQSADNFSKKFVDQVSAGMASAGALIQNPKDKQKYIKNIVTNIVGNSDISQYQQKLNTAINNISTIDSAKNPNGLKTELANLGKMLYSVGLAAKEKPQAQNQRTQQVQQNTQQQSTGQTTGLAKGVDIVNDDPMIIKYNGQDYGIGNNGEWINNKNNKPANPNIQQFLHQQADIHDSATATTNTIAQVKSLLGKLSPTEQKQVLANLQKP